MRPSKFFPSALLAMGLSALSACGSTNDNSFSFSWRLVDAAQADPTTAPALACADAGVSTIRLILQAQGSPGQPIQVDFDCNLGAGLTAPVREDNYTFLALALAQSGPLSQLSFTQSNVGGPADLGLIIFQIKK